MIPHEAIDLPPAQDGIAENEQVAQQVVVHEAIDLPPAPQAANAQLPVPEATGAQRAVPHRPRDAGVPLVYRQVQRPATLQFVTPPRDKEIAGKAWRHGKNFRHERKVKSAKKASTAKLKLLQV